MFKTTTALSKSAHRHLRLSGGHGYGFAARETVLPLVASEIAQAAREYAIVFDGAPGGLPLALTGLPPGGNAYVGPAGRWLARYVPVHVRRYPFVLAEVASQSTPQAEAEATDAALAGREVDRRYVLHIASNAPLLSTTQGMPLFDEEGAPAEPLQKAQQLLLSLQKGFDRTRALVGQLEAQQLLSPQTLRISPQGGEPAVISGFRLLDHERLAALDGAALARLRDSGALLLAHAHLLSLQNLRDGLLADPARWSANAGTPAPGGLGLPENEALSFEGIDWASLSPGGKH